MEAQLILGLEQANNWDVDQWAASGGQSDIEELQLCVRTTVHLARLRFDYLHKIPWLLVRVLEPGTKEVVLAQWASCLPDEHYRISQRFLSQILRLHN